MLKSDKWIAAQCAAKLPLLYPYVGKSVKEDDLRNRLISYGLSSYGYDIRCAPEFKYHNGGSYLAYIDPKNVNEENFTTINADYFILEPNSLVLTRSLEYIRMPRNVTGICVGKSTYARIGLIANVTPLEAGWQGHLTIELSNTSKQPIKVYANEGICQILFFESAEECVTSYEDRGGKYNGQIGITSAKV